MGRAGGWGQETKVIGLVDRAALERSFPYLRSRNQRGLCPTHFLRYSCVNLRGGSFGAPNFWTLSRATLVRARF